MAGGVITAAWVQGLCTLLPTSVLAAAAIYGLRAWQPQARGQRAIERAEHCLTALHEVVDLIRTARAQGMLEVSVVDDSPESLQAALRASRSDSIQRAWQSWQRFAEAYRRAGFYIQLPETDAARELASILAKLSGLAKLIDEYSRLENDPTTHGRQFRQQAQKFRADFFGIGKTSSGAGDTDQIEKVLTSTVRSVEAVCRPLTSGERRSTGA